MRNNSYELNNNELKQVNGGAMSRNMDDVYNYVARILGKHLNLKANSISLQSSIVDDLGADSLDVVDIVSMMEEEYNFHFDPAMYSNIKSVKDLCMLVINIK